MIKYLKIIYLDETGASQRDIAKIVGSSRNTIRRILTIAKEKGLTHETLKNMDQTQLEELFSPSNKANIKAEQIYQMPDYEVLVKELSKPGVTMKLLWEEYVSECEYSNYIPYSLTQFKKYFHDHIKQHCFSDIIHHKPGESVEVDWAGTTVKFQNPDTGEQVEGYLFVGVLSYSLYAYAEVCADMKQESWNMLHN